METAQIVDESLKKVARGTGIIFLSTIVAILLGFAGRTLVARSFTQSEYGVFSLAFIILMFFVTISTLGLQEGAARQIAFYREKKDEAKVRGTVHSSLWLGLIAGILLFLALLFASDSISTKIFDEPALSTPLRIFSAAIPFFVLIHILTAIFRAFDQVKPKVYFNDILRIGLFPLFLLPVIFLDLSFSTAMYAFSASIIITCITFAVYAIKKAAFLVERERRIALNPVGKKLLFFSLPLLGVNMVMMIMVWTDTLMLGYFKTPEVVGLYNAALPLANLIPIVLSSVNFLYLPIASQLYARDEREQMRRDFAVLTKWIFLGTLPIFFILLLFPDTILNLLFGSQYVGAALALQILVLGFFLNPTTGPNFHAMIVIGKTRDLMWVFLISAIINIALNYLLIPPLGITGAAIASASSVALATTAILIRLYWLSGIHPATKNYFKSIILAVIFMGIIYAIKHFLVISLWMPFAFLAAFIAVYGFSLLWAKSFDREDITLLLQIEKGLGINLTSLKGILKRFM